MKVLLHADVEKLGYLGDVVDVADGYARNYLLPQGLAVEPLESNIKAIEQERARCAEERSLVRKELEKAAERVKDAHVVIAERANEQGHLFGSVGQTDIADALREKGFEVQDKHIVLSEHFRMLGTFDVTLKFADDLSVAVKVDVVQPEGQGDDNSTEPETDAQPEPNSESESESESESDTDW